MNVRRSVWNAAMPTSEKIVWLWCIENAMQKSNHCAVAAFECGMSAEAFKMVLRELQFRHYLMPTFTDGAYFKCDYGPQAIHLKGGQVSD